MFKLISLLLVTVVCACIIFFSFTPTYKKPDTNILLVGTNAEFPPFTFRTEGAESEIVGFDIDIVKEVCHRLGKEIQFKDMPFDALIPDLTLGHVDFVAAGMTATPERAQRVSFTKSYLSEDGLVIISLKKANSQKALTLDDYLGKTIVVNEGFTADLFLSAKEGFNLIRLPTVADGFVALKSGRADAFVTAQSTVRSFLETQDASQFQQASIEGSAENCALVTPKNSILLTDIQKALDAMEKDGTLKQLKLKWKLQ